MKAVFFLLICVIIITLPSFGKVENTRISGNLSFLKKNDSIILILYKYGQFYGNLDLKVTHISRLINHSFCFNFSSINYPHYIDLLFPQKHANNNIYSFLIETGDNIEIIEKDGEIKYIGLGSEKWNVQTELRNIQISFSKIIPGREPMYIKRRFELIDSSVVSQLTYIKANHCNLSDNVFTLLNASIIANSLIKTRDFQFIQESDVQPALRSLGYYKNNILSELSNNVYCNEILQYSTDDFVSCFIEKYRFDSCLIMNRQFSVKYCYIYLKECFSGPLKEKIVAAFLFKYKNKSPDLAWCLNDAISFIRNKDFLEVLQKLKFYNTAGAYAYNFKLPDIHGNIRMLSDFKGKVILIDFWYTGCPMCIDLHLKLKEIEKRIVDEDFVLISISIDTKKDVWIKSVKSEKYTSKNTINLFTSGKGKNHPVIEVYNITSYPTLILVDRDGKLCINTIDPRLDGGENLISLIKNACK